MKLRSLALASTLLLSPACINPYGCEAEYRFAEFKGILGVDDLVEREVAQMEPGRIYFSLDEGRGSGAFRQVSLSFNVWGMVASVAEVHVHKATAPDSGKLLFSTSSGYMVRDSVWNGYPQAFSGPVSWDEFWDTLGAGNSYLEIHPADGQPAVRGRLTPANSRGFQPSCT